MKDETEMKLEDIYLFDLVLALTEYNLNEGSLVNVPLAGMISDIEFEIKRRTAQERIEREFKTVLGMTGLSLETVKMPATVFCGDSSISASSMRLNISNPEKFIKYLASLSLPLDPAKAYGLAEVAQILVIQVVGQYRFGDPRDERIINLFSCQKQMVVRYEELGLGDSVKELAGYFEIAKQGYIREYLLAKNLGLYPESGFGPSKWHTNMTKKRYLEKWLQAINAINLVFRNPRAAEFAKKFQIGLINSANLALKDLQDRPMNSDNEFFQEALRDSLFQLMRIPN
jgi:hypothetical protein